MTHTLGPLRVVGPAVAVLCEDGTTLLGGDCDILDEHDKVIAETYQYVGDDSVRPAHANAILFAAAPALLAMCKAGSQRLKAVAAVIDGIAFLTKAEYMDHNNLYDALDGWDDIDDAIASATDDEGG